MFSVGMDGASSVCYYFALSPAELDGFAEYFTAQWGVACGYKCGKFSGVRNCWDVMRSKRF